MDTDERLERIESDIHEMKADMSDIKVSLAERKATLPHVATKAEVEEAKHEATQGQVGYFVSV